MSEVAYIVELERANNELRSRNRWLEERHTDAVTFLQAVAMHPGNLSDEEYTLKTGPNDAVARGLKVVAMRQIAKNGLHKLGKEAQ